MSRKPLAIIVGISALMLSTNIASAQKPALPTIKLCTGQEGLNYNFAGTEIRKQAKDILNINLIPSTGSLKNLEGIENGTCDVAIVQSDALNIYSNISGFELGPVLYKEYWHLICNEAANINRITDLTAKNKILIGPNGSGTAVTWESFVKADPARYEVVQHEPIGGLRAAAIVQEGSNAQCMALVTGLNSNAIKEINENAKQKGNLRLVPSNDRDILKTKDGRGRKVYSDVEIPSGTYSGGLQPRSLFGSSVNTVAVNAVIVASSKYIDEHEPDYNKFLRAVNAAIPSIKGRVEPH